MKNGSYEMVVAPGDYPGKKYRGRYCYEHQLVYWHEYKIIPKSNQLIHHINGDKRDNCIENLVLMTVARHNTKHSLGAKMLKMKCTWCSNRFDRSEREARFKRKHGQKNFFCSLSCGAKHQYS